MDAIRNAITVDVEDYFQVTAFEKHISRENWDNLPHRIEANIDTVLSIFEEHDVYATFFMLGWIAERYPQMVHDIVNSGHELASHGYSHIRATQQSQTEFREDILKTKNLLEDISGVLVVGYRAASYSITRNNLWAHNEIENAGYQYSSSVYPIKHDLYGIPDAPRFPYKIDKGDLLEIPISTVQFFRHRIPCGGGGYFRLYPYFISRYLIGKVNKHENMPCIFYFHPWEIDKDQPKQMEINYKARFRHYLNLSKTEARIKRLLKDFKWGRVDKVFNIELNTHKA